MARVDYDEMAAAYVQGRSLDDWAVAPWRAPIDEAIEHRRGLRIVDLGAGTGEWTGRLAGWFDAEVIGVEPSDSMRAAAVERLAPEVPEVRFVAGDAARIPLGRGEADVVWLSNVWHHIADPGAAAAEFTRVLADDGVLLIRNAFADRLEFPDDWVDTCRASGLDGHVLTPAMVFPEALGVLATFPTLLETDAVLARAGLERRRVELVPQGLAGSIEAFAVRLRTRADSTLTEMSDEAWRAGLERLDGLVATTPPGRIVAGLTLASYRRSPS